MNKLPSLSIFFPFYNDAGTVAPTIEDAYKWGAQVARRLEVIALHGGPSVDDTFKRIRIAQKKHPSLIVIDRRDNQEGYSVIKYGFAAAHYKWTFYTDGDRQYNLDDLPRLVRLQSYTGADVVNGYKISRLDSRLRVILGDGYRAFVQSMFQPPISDVTCDFRLIRTDRLQSIKLRSTNASILIEMIKKLEHQGARFAETPVSHYARRYGQSTYRPMSLLSERIRGDIILYYRMKKAGII